MRTAPQYSGFAQPIVEDGVAYVSTGADDVFALSIDDFVVTSYLAKGADTETVPIKLYSAARGAPTPALNALASIMVVITLLSLALAYVVYKRLSRGTDGSALESIGGI